MAMAFPPAQGVSGATAATFAFLDPFRRLGAAVILLLHPRSTKPKNRRFPLSVLSLAAVLEGSEDYRIIDGNLVADPAADLEAAVRDNPVELLGVSVMPGPQMAEAIPLCRTFRQKFPAIPIVWGGYFPSLYPDAAQNAGYVDFAVRGQGEDTLLELLEAVRRQRGYASVRGLSYKDHKSRHVHNPERVFRGPDEFPRLPYCSIDAEKYVLPTFLGSRTAVHQASVGCPYQCNFCGVITAYGSREKMESPARTEMVLRRLQREYGINAVQFYDNNFFLREEHAREQADRFAPLELHWWCEARVDAMLRYSDDTLRRISRAGAKMIFFGAESGSDWVLAQMNKQLKAEQTLELARRIREFGIIPEFSFVVGNPQAPEQDVKENLAFVRKIKKVNPDAEIILQHYIPTPQRDGMYGGVESQVEFPLTPEEWANPKWLNFTTREEPGVSWLPRRTKQRVDDFELVVSSRWPTAQDFRMPKWGRVLLQGLSSWRYALGVYRWPRELEWAQKLVELRKPRFESL
jgi:radical SAM superfamily enzyme YgiQ (UPF0313 family)